MAETYSAGVAGAIGSGGRRSRSMRGHLRDGLEAALRSDPAVVATSRTRTGLGLVARELVLAAAGGKTPAIKVMLSLLDWTDTDQRTAGAQPVPPEGDSQEYEKTSVATEPRWDWNAAGDWDSPPQPKPEPEPEPETPEPGTGAAPEDDHYLRMLRARFERMHEAQQAENAEKEAKAQTEGAP